MKKQSIFQRLSALFFACIAAVVFAFSTMPAAHAYQVPITVGIDGSPTELAKSCSNPSQYNMAYKGTLDMTEVWSTFNTLKSIYRIGSTSGDWDTLHLTGSWNMSWTIDPQYVEVAQGYLTKEVFQAAYEQANPNTSFTRYVTVVNDPVIVDGRISVTYVLGDSAHGLDYVTASQLDVANDPTVQAPSLTFISGDGALYVPASKFVAGQSFVGKDPIIDGTMNIKHANGADLNLSRALPFLGWFGIHLNPGESLLPLTYHNDGGDVRTTMVDRTVNYSFVAQDGSALPQDVLNLLPACATAAKDEAVTPVSTFSDIETEEGTWSFVEWDRASDVMADSGLSFVGTWKFVAKPRPIVQPSPATVVPTTPAQKSTATTNLPLTGVNILGLAGGVSLLLVAGLGIVIYNKRKR